MAIPVILKGDTAATIHLRLADGYDYADCWLDVSFCGIVTTRELPQSGSVIDLHFTANETAGFPLGTSKVFFALRNSAGAKKSLPWAKIKVTDAPEEVASPVIVIDPATLGDIDTTAADSLGDVKRKLNQLLSVLRGGALCLVAALCSCAHAALTPTTQLNDVPGNTTISNLVASSGAAVAGGGISDEDVASITNAMTAYVNQQDAKKADKTSQEGYSGVIGTEVIYGMLAAYGVDYANYANQARQAENASKATESTSAMFALSSMILSDQSPTRANPSWWFGYVAPEVLTYWQESGTTLTNAWTRDLPSEAKMKEIAGTALGRTYDEELGITWVKVARGGAFYEVCETNINTAVIK